MHGRMLTGRQRFEVCESYGLSTEVESVLYRPDGCENV